MTNVQNTNANVTAAIEFGIRPELISSKFAVDSKEMLAKRELRKVQNKVVKTLRYAHWQRQTTKVWARGVKEGFITAEDETFKAERKARGLKREQTPEEIAYWTSQYEAHEAAFMSCFEHIFLDVSSLTLEEMNTHIQQMVEWAAYYLEGMDTLDKILTRNGQTQAERYNR